MHGLPKSLDWSRLTGAVLNQVCVGHHNIRLNFYPNISISVESSLRLDGMSEASENFGELATALCSLIEQEIVNARPSGERTVSIQIGNRTLEMFEDSEPFESFVITIGSDVFVV